LQEPTPWWRVNGRIEEMLQRRHFRSGEEPGSTLDRYARHSNRRHPQSALGIKPRLQAMKGWPKRKPELFTKQPSCLPGCDS